MADENMMPPHSPGDETPPGPSMMRPQAMPEALRDQASKPPPPTPAAPPLIDTSSFENAANEIARRPRVNYEGVLSGGTTEPPPPAAPAPIQQTVYVAGDPQAGAAPSPVGIDLSAVGLPDARATVERRIAQRPKDIRDAAHELSQAFTKQVELIKNSKPNDPARLAEFEDLVAFFERMAAGLANLVEALDKLGEAAGTEREPMFLGKAGEIARQLDRGLMDWLQQNRTKVFDYPFKIGVFGAGVLFLHYLGIDGDKVSELIGGYILGRATSNKSD